MGVRKEEGARAAPGPQERATGQVTLESTGVRTELWPIIAIKVWESRRSFKSRAVGQRLRLRTRPGKSVS